MIDIQIIWNTFFAGNPIYHMSIYYKFKDWPDMKEYSEYTGDYIYHEGQELNDIFAKLDMNGIELMRKFLCYQPEKRLSAENALQRIYIS